MKKFAQINDISEIVQKGNLSDLPEQFVVDLSTINAADYQALLEVARYRIFGHQINASLQNKKNLGDEKALDLLNDIRSLIHNGQFEEALTKIESMRSNDHELLIEKSRCFAFLGRFQDVVHTLSPIIHDGLLRTASKGVALQIMGQAYLELGELKKAKVFLDSALEQSALVGNVIGALSAHWFLSRYFMFADDVPSAESHLQRVRDIAFSTKSFRWLLSYYRLQYFFNVKTGDVSKAAKYSVAGIHFARALSDKTFEARGIKELEELLGPNYKVASNVETDASWIHDTENKILIDLKANEFTNLGADSPLAKILSYLASRPDGVDRAELFTHVWQIKFNKERHAHLLRITLGRFNKLGPSLKVSNSESIIKIKKSGIRI